MSGDLALGEYVPQAPVNDEARKHNEKLPGMGGVFNTVNLHTYHYAGNNPVKYVDPTGMMDELAVVKTIVDNITKNNGDFLAGIMGAINDLKKENFTVSKEAILGALKDQNVKIPSEYASIFNQLKSISYTGDSDGKKGNLTIAFAGKKPNKIKLDIML